MAMLQIFGFSVQIFQFFHIEIIADVPTNRLLTFVTEERTR